MYLEEAKRIFEEGIYEYIELYTVPNSMDKISKWESLDIPFTVHAPHCAHGFNPAFSKKKHSNFKAYQEASFFAERLNADYIIFHGGNRGCIESTVSQLLSFNDSRTVIENLPYHTLRDQKRCFGATPKEIQYIKENTGCMFCLDILHAICSANSQGLEPYSYIESFLELKPVMFHIAGLKDINSTADNHLSLLNSKLDAKKIAYILPHSAKVTIETPKRYDDNLYDFYEDVKWMRSL